MQGVEMRVVAKGDILEVPGEAEVTTLDTLLLRGRVMNGRQECFGWEPEAVWSAGTPFGRKSLLDSGNTRRPAMRFTLIRVPYQDTDWLS